MQLARKLLELGDIYMNIRVLITLVERKSKTVIILNTRIRRIKLSLRNLMLYFLLPLKDSLN